MRLKLRRVLTLFTLLISLAASAWGQSNGTVAITVNNVATNITTDRACFSILIRENSASPTAIFSITPTRSSTTILLAAGGSYEFVAPGGFPFAAGQTIGTIVATTAGPFNFIAMESAIGSSRSLIIQKSGVSSPRQSKLNFTGTAVTSVVDDPANERTTVTLTAAGGGAGAVLQTNESNTADQALLDLKDTSSVAFTNPSGGIVSATVRSNSITMAMLASLMGSAPGTKVPTTSLASDPTTNNCTKWIAGGILGDAGTPCGSGGGSLTFIGLTDVPANFTGSGFKYVRVNSTATALEFTTNLQTTSGGCTILFDNSNVNSFSDCPPASLPISITETKPTAIAAGLMRTNGSGVRATNSELSGFTITNGSNATTPGKNDVLQTSGYCADAGANDTYACNLSPAITAYVTGTRYRFKANTANTGAASINFNAVGLLPIKKVQGGITTDPADNDIRADQWVECIYDGTNCQMLSMLGNTPSGSGDATQANIQNGSYVCATTATGTDAYAITLTPTPSTYALYQTFCFKADVANTTAATLAVNGQAARTIKKAEGGVTTDLATNDIRAGQMVYVADDGTNYQILSNLGVASGGLTSPVGVADGGTGSTTATAARAALDINYGIYGVTRGPLSPLDATLYYIGLVDDPHANTVDGAPPHQVIVPISGTVKRFCVITRVNGTLGTTENVVMVLRKNGTTDSTESVTQVWNVGDVAVGCVNLTTAFTVAADDKLTLKVTSPTWTTNPTNVLIQWSAKILQDQ